jgi:hypothetical protein
MTLRFGFFVRLPKTCSPMYVRLTIIFRTWEFGQILALRRVRLPVANPWALQAEAQGIPVRFKWSAIF